MGIGYLIVETRTHFETLPVAGARVTVRNSNGEILHTLTTDASGRTERISLETVDRTASLDPNFQGHPYTSYNIEARAEGFETIFISGVHIFEGETAIQPVTMIPMLRDETTPSQFNIVVGEQAVEMDEPRNQEGITPIQARVLRHVVIPNIITVHLGRPTDYAQDVRVPFIDYVKNVASHEIYPTWPENSLRANIYVIVTFALNRIFTEWYRSRGFSFDITNSTAYDQYYVYGGTIYESVSRIVDQIFNHYVRRAGQLSPFFTSFCNGTTATCAGLSQWGTVSLANSGLNPLQILRHYYPSDVEISQSMIFTSILQSYPGTPLRLGDRGLNVQIIQKYLNRIRRNYPSIPVIAAENGVFGADTEAAVKAFQRIFDQMQDGVVGSATWYRISYIFVAVARLAELDSEGSSLGIGTVPPNIVLRQGSVGPDVITLQYILAVISEFYPVIPSVSRDGVFGVSTTQAVTAFQRMMNLFPDGIVGAATWSALYDTYWGIQNNTRPSPSNVTEYTVRSGDTLYLLAQRFGTTVDIIRRLNGLTSDALMIGQVLRIPVATPVPPEITPPTPPAGYFNYTVVSGDTLYLLSRRFGTTVDAIKSLNGLTSDSLNIGQVLKIPSVSPPITAPPSPNYINYTVRPGDTLYYLATRFGTTVAAIRSANNLTSDILNIGQALRIPGSFFSYTVKAGDTLYLLSQRFGVSVNSIMALNNLTGSALSIGQVLFIPQA